MLDTVQQKTVGEGSVHNGGARGPPGGNLVASAPAGWAAAPNSCSMPAASLVALRARPRRRLLRPKRWGPEQAGPRPCGDYPDRSYQAACAGRSPRPMASIPLPLLAWQWRAAELSPGQPETQRRRAPVGCPRPALPTTPAPWPLGRSWQSPAPARWGLRSRPQGKGAGAVTVTMRIMDHNPHNPTGQALESHSLGPCLGVFALVIVDEPSCRWCPAARPITDPVAGRSTANLIVIAA